MGIMDEKGDAAISGISGFTLKMIAVVTMFIDHLAASLLFSLINNFYSDSYSSLWINSDNYDLWFDIYNVMRGIGRMAFPIYIFLLIEGFSYSKSRGKYACRLAVFALISEIPFDLAFRKSFFDISYNNVFITLLLGLITVIVLDFMKSKMTKLDASKSIIAWFGINTFRCIIMIAFSIAIMALAEFVFRCDYGAGGISAIVVMYLLGKNKMLGFAATCIMLGLTCGQLEFCALLMLIPIYFYNGSRGKQCKYFFYAFYPAHLLLIVLIGKLLNIY